MLSKAATSASTACASSARAPLRKTSVSGSAKVPGWVSWKTLVSVTAYHSFGGEVGGFEHPPRYAAVLPFHAVTNFRRQLAQNRDALLRVNGRDICQLASFWQFCSRYEKMIFIYTYACDSMPH